VREVRMGRNSFFGLLGFGVPVVVLLAAYPILLHALGMKTLGIYLLATSMSGALAFLDAGFSAATLKFVAEDLANGRKYEAARILIASTIFYGSVGAAAALVLWLLSPWLVSIFGIDAAMRPVALTCFRLASLQFAVFFTLTVFISLFKGMHRFDLSTLSLSLLSMLTYGGAVAAVRFAHSGLVGVTAAGLGANVFVLALSAVMALRVCIREGLPLAHTRPALATYKRMFAFGSFMTINGLASLFLLQIQKYLIGIHLGTAAVGVYQTASVPPAKIHAAVNAATEVLFPMASASRDPVRLRQLYLRMLGATLAFAALAFFPLAFFGSRVLSFWLGRQDSPELQSLIVILAIAYFFQAITPPPFHLLNGLGRPWINTLFFLLTALLNVSFIAIAVLTGVTLTKVAWAFAAAMITCVVAYHITVEFYVSRRLQSAELTT
jgi:O-antigen/teichoic acid export membrane protein